MNWKRPLPSASGRRSTVVAVGVAEIESWPSRREFVDRPCLRSTASLSLRGVTPDDDEPESGVLAGVRSASTAGAEAATLPAASVAVTTTVPLVTAKVAPGAIAVPAEPLTEYESALRPDRASPPVAVHTYVTPAPGVQLTPAEGATRSTLTEAVADASLPAPSTAWKVTLLEPLASIVY